MIVGKEIQHVNPDLKVQRHVTHVIRPDIVVLNGLVEADAESTEKTLTVNAWGDSLPQRSQALFAGDGGHSAKHTCVFWCGARHRRPLKLQPHLRSIERQGT